jgi:hypothetical protein
VEERNIQFHMTEYSSLIPAFMENLKTSYNAVIYGIIANAAIVAWVSSNLDRVGQKNIIALSACLAPLISGASGAIYVRRQANADRIYSYLYTVEAKLAAAGLGYIQFEKLDYSKNYYIGSSVVFSAICLLHAALTLYFAYFIFLTV